MNRAKRYITTIMLVPALALATVQVQAQAPVGEPGYVDFEAVTQVIGAVPDVNLNFGSAMLMVFAETLREKDPNLADMLRGLKGLRVMVYEQADGAVARDFASVTGAELLALGWDEALTVRETDTHVDLFLRTSNDRIRGLALMVTESGGTAVFVNVVGELDPAAIGKLISGTGLDLSALGAMAGQFGNGGD